MNGSSELMEQEYARFRAEFQRTRDEVLSLTSELANLKSSTQGSVGDLRASLNAVATKVEEKSKLNLPAIALALAIVPAIWLFVTTYTTSEINRAVTPVISASAINSKQIDSMSGSITTLQQLTAGSGRADESSVTDRKQLNDRVRQLESELSKETGERHSAATEGRVKLGEIETQFHAVSDLGNLRTVWQHRINALLWEKTYPGEHYPSEAFFPTTVFGGGSTMSPP